jgi:prepilin-type N-terminal cleavage/methylation domain-containing protein/prepilin-type processing-associated H-X9-DG protein
VQEAAMKVDIHRPTPLTRKQRKAGFTLIEILVVLSIAALLSSLSLSAFHRVREQGRRSVCQNNLHQIALAMQQYVADNNGYYPVNMSPDSIDWRLRIMPYLNNTQVFLCPSFIPWEPGPDYPAGTMRSNYEFNIRRLNAMDATPPPTVISRHESKVNAYASSIWLNYCLQGAFHPNGTSRMDAVASSCGRTEYFPALHPHTGGTNYSYLDGHVKWLTNQQMAEMECQNPPNNKSLTDN